MARNAIESEFRTSKMGAAGHFVKNSKKKLHIDLKWLEMRSKVNERLRPFGTKFQNKIKFCINLKWPEMPSKVSFLHPKWPPAAIL